MLIGFPEETARACTGGPGASQAFLPRSERCAICISVNTHKAFFTLAAALIIALCSPGCAGRTKSPDVLAPETFADLSLPLDVREYRVARSTSGQGIFIKLSRLPDAIDHHLVSRPPSIVLDIKGPTGPDTGGEESLEAESPLSRIRITRHPNVLRVSLDLDADEAPQYSVHLLADWIMIRLEGPGYSGIPVAPYRG